MNEIQSRNVLSIDGTLHATYAGRKALIFWPNVVKLLCGGIHSGTIEIKIHSAYR